MQRSKNVKFFAIKAHLRSDHLNNYNFRLIMKFALTLLGMAAAVKEEGGALDAWDGDLDLELEWDTAVTDVVGGEPDIDALAGLTEDQRWEGFLYCTLEEGACADMGDWEAALEAACEAGAEGCATVAEFFEEVGEIDDDWSDDWSEGDWSDDDSDDWSGDDWSGDDYGSTDGYGSTDDYGDYGSTDDYGDYGSTDDYGDYGSTDDYGESTDDWWSSWDGSDYGYGSDDDSWDMSSWDCDTACVEEFEAEIEAWCAENPEDCEYDEEELA